MSNCWDNTPDQCRGCPYCAEARATPADQPVTYPDETQARAAHVAEQNHRIALAQTRLDRNRR